jgi:glycosyltransferase involved in cell wall biosynthesis
LRLLLTHNRYGMPSGEETVIAGITAVLLAHDHSVRAFERSSADIRTARQAVKAFFSGIYSGEARCAFAKELSRNRPDLVHVHNVFPLISPSVLPVCRQAGVPVVMTVHNYRLICPDGLHMTDGQVCQRCCGGREYWCVLRNCERSIFKSLGYALRNYVARRFRLFMDNVTLYAALTEFQKCRLIAAGLAEDRIVVIPNMAELPGPQPQWQLGQYVGFVGRVSPEKGVNLLVSAGREHKDIPFKIAGDFSRLSELPGQASANVEFLGALSRASVSNFYSQCRMIVLPSIWFEGFPMVLAEAMLHGKPVICSNIGGLGEIVEDGLTGLLFEPGNAEELSQKIRYLWDRPDLCRQMGSAGRQKARREYSSEKYYERLLAVYEQALTLGAGGPKQDTHNHPQRVCK